MSWNPCKNLKRCCYKRLSTDLDCMVEIETLVDAVGRLWLLRLARVGDRHHVPISFCPLCGKAGAAHE